MPIKGEEQGYTYKALINGEWQEVTIQESPLELMERFEQDVEWTRVRHGHWIFNPKDAIEMMFTLPKCSECGAESPNGGNYCPNCGAKMDEVREYV